MNSSSAQIEEIAATLPNASAISMIEFFILLKRRIDASGFATLGELRVPWPMVSDALQAILAYEDFSTYKRKLKNSKANRNICNEMVFELVARGYLKAVLFDDREGDYKTWLEAIRRRLNSDAPEELEFYFQNLVGMGIADYLAFLTAEHAKLSTCGDSFEPFNSLIRRDFAPVYNRVPFLRSLVNYASMAFPERVTRCTLHNEKMMFLNREKIKDNLMIEGLLLMRELQDVELIVTYLSAFLGDSERRDLPELCRKYEIILLSDS